MNWQAAKLRSEVIAIWVGLASVLCGGLYTLIEYRRHKEFEAAKEALSYVQRFQQSPIHEAQSKVTEVWNRREGDLKKAARSGADGYAQFLAAVIREEKMEPQVFALLGFYESLATCAAKGWCDREISSSFFCFGAKGFLRTHYQFIADKRRGWGQPELGGEAERFAARCSRSA